MSNPSPTLCRGQKMDRRHPLQTLNGHLPLKLGSDRPQTLPKRVSDDPRHFIFRWKCFRNFRKLWRSVYPPRMAPIGLELGQNAFQTIPNISSFDLETQFCFWIVARSHDDMIIWSYDHMIVWSYDDMIIWSYDHKSMAIPYKKQEIAGNLSASIPYIL